jgi:hypothetical protein
MSNDAYFEAAMENYEEEYDEYEPEDDEEEEYCPACGFPNCSGFCL